MSKDSQQIAVGMPISEAIEIGGGFTFEVVADLDVWPRSANPFAVIAAQATKPDKSIIKLVFSNRSQFSTAVDVRFRVEIKSGFVASIERLS